MIKRCILATLALCVSLAAQTTYPTPAFPGALATQSQLKLGINGTSIYLYEYITNTQTTFYVSGCSGVNGQPPVLTANVLITIDQEIMPIASCSGTSLVVASRGFDSTVAAPHNQGAVVSANVAAWNVNAPDAEIIAIETALGPNLVHVFSAFPPPLGYTFDGQFSSLAAGCAASFPGTLVVSVPWNVLSTQALNCNLEFKGNGKIQSANGQIVTVNGSVTCPVGQQCFDAHLGGPGSILLASPTTTTDITNWGAYTGASDNAPFIQAAIQGLPHGGTITIPASAGGFLVATNLALGTNSVSFQGFSRGSASTSCDGSCLIVPDGAKLFNQGATVVSSGNRFSNFKVVATGTGSAFVIGSTAQSYSDSLARRSWIFEDLYLTATTYPSGTCGSFTQLQTLKVINIDCEGFTTGLVFDRTDEAVPYSGFRLASCANCLNVEVQDAPSGGQNYFSNVIIDAAGDGSAPFKNATAVTFDSPFASMRDSKIELQTGWAGTPLHLTNESGDQHFDNILISEDAIATSSTSHTIGTGAQTFTVAANGAWFPGAYFRAQSSAAPQTNNEIGTVTSYSGTSLVVNITTANGSGAHTDWALGMYPATIQIDAGAFAASLSFIKSAGPNILPVFIGLPSGGQVTHFSNADAYIGEAIADGGNNPSYYSNCWSTNWQNTGFNGSQLVCAQPTSRFIGDVYASGTISTPTSASIGSGINVQGSPPLPANNTGTYFQVGGSAMSANTACYDSGAQADGICQYDASEHVFTIGGVVALRLSQILTGTGYAGWFLDANANPFRVSTGTVAAAGTCTVTNLFVPYQVTDLLTPAINTAPTGGGAVRGTIQCLYDGTNYHMHVIGF